MTTASAARPAPSAETETLAPIAPPPSRLPQVGTTIFTVMSALAAEKQAVNLGQGFPDFDCDPRIVDAVSDAMRAGLNQYPPMTGVPALRQAIAAKIATLYGHTYDADREITVTAGATQALLTAVLCCVHPGDEVIVFEPTYDSYLPSIELAGGKAVPITLDAPDYRIPFDRLAAAITPRTRLIMLNTPHNPTGTVWHADDMRKLAEIVAPTDVLLLSDEVYEHMVYDGVPHASVARIPELARRAFVVSSFGKTYHVTGWKVGYVAAPAALSAEFRKVHQFNVFTVNTPMQHGLAAYMAWPTRARTWSCPRSTSTSATCSARGWSTPASSCCRARAPTSSAWTTAPSPTCPRPNSPSGSPARSAWRRSRWRRSIRSRTNRAWCGSASPRRTRHSGWRWSVCRSCKPAERYWRLLA